MSKNTGNTILAILTGAAIELVLEFYLSDKGSKNKSIKDSYKDAQKDLQKKYEELSEEVKTNSLV
jgi:chaperonin GroEL (HSP60 family)